MQPWWGILILESSHSAVLRRRFATRMCRSFFHLAAPLACCACEIVSVSAQRGCHEQISCKTEMSFAYTVTIHTGAHT